MERGSLGEGGEGSLQGVGYPFAAIPFTISLCPSHGTCKMPGSQHKDRQAKRKPDNMITGDTTFHHTDKEVSKLFPALQTPCFFLQFHYPFYHMNAKFQYCHMQVSCLFDSSGDHPHSSMHYVAILAVFQLYLDFSPQEWFLIQVLQNQKLTTV